VFVLDAVVGIGVDLMDTDWCGHAGRESGTRATLAATSRRGAIGRMTYAGRSGEVVLEGRWRILAGQT